MRKRGSSLGALVVIVAACGGNEFTPALPPGAICNPGSESECTCPTGANGTRVCAGNGQEFAECVCAGGDAGVVPIASGRGTTSDAGDASHPVPPNCELAAATWQIMQPCPIGAPSILYDCPSGAPPDSFGCLQPNPARALWCCPL